MGWVGCVTVGVCLAASCMAQTAAKAVKDEGEFNLFNDVIKDVGGGNFTKAVADLDAWKQKYPESDYRDERTGYYIQAYAGLAQPEKVLAAMGEFAGKELDAVFPGPAGQPMVIRILYSATWAISRLTNPTAQELTIGERAARQLMAYDRQIPGVTAEQWKQARADMREKAEAALLHVAMLPGMQAMAKNPPDCAAAELAYFKAVGDYPDKAVLSYELGRALSCVGKKNPEKLSLAIYAFERAAVTDPKLGNPAGDAKKVQDFADSSYVRYHGSDEGLAQLKELVKQSPLPPAGFQIKSGSEIAGEQEAAFAKQYPQLALWKRIRAALGESNGEQYFETQLKDSAVPPLKGTLLEAKPACRPKELLVGVPMPDAKQGAQAEIVLKLDKPLAGRPQVNGDFQWEGVPTAFSKSPFLLTMEAETAKIQGLKTAACGRVR